jgi:O-antigen/teichoic acid export membrane protein
LKARIKAIFNKGTFSKFSLYLLASLLSSGISVLINPLLAINLNPDDYAVIGYYVSLNTLFAPLISLQLLSYYKRIYFKESAEKLIVIRNTLLSFQMLAGVIISTISISTFYLYATYSGVSFEVFPYILLSVSSIFFGMFSTFLLTEEQLKGNAKFFFVFSMINLIFSISSALIFVVALKWGATGRFLGFSITAFIMACLALRYLKFKFYINIPELKTALKFSWPILASAILYFAFGGYDRILLERLNETETLGIYNVAFQITGYVNFFGLAIRQTFEPQLYKATANNNVRKAVYVMILVFVIMLFACCIFNLLAPFIIDILTYGRYTAAVPFAQALVFRNAAMVLAFMSSDILIGLGHSKIELRNRIIGAILAIAGFTYLITEYQFWGAAWGQSIALCVMSLISMITLIGVNKKLKNQQA